MYLFVHVGVLPISIRINARNKPDWNILRATKRMATMKRKTIDTMFHQAQKLFLIATLMQRDTIDDNMPYLEAISSRNT